MLGTTVQTDGHWPTVRVEVITELGSNHDLISNRFERFADEFLVRPWAIDLRRVEERDAQIDGATDQIDHGGGIGCPAIDRIKTHTSEPQLRYN